MKILMVPLTLLFTCFYSFGQLDYIKRFETELKDSYTSEEVYDFGEKGLILLSVSKDKVDGRREWKVDHYDTGLNLINTHTFQVHKKYEKDKFNLQDEQLHMLLNKGKGRIGILGIDLSSGLVEMNITEVKIPKKLSIDLMYSTGEITFLAGEINKFMSRDNVVVQVNHNSSLASIEIIQIPGAKAKHLEFEDISKDELSSNIIFHMSEENRDVKRMISHFIIYNDSGERHDKFEIADNSEKSITSLSSTQLTASERIITGTYAEDWKNTSSGMFLGKMNHQKIEYINYIPFTELENFLNYLPERKQERIEKKKARKKRKGKSFELNYRMISHGIIEVRDGKGGYLLIGEAYYPTYSSVPYTITGANGSVTTQYRTVFDGYQYTHAVIARFDKEGNLLWDHIMELNISRKPMYVKRFISIAKDKQSGIKTTYSSNFKIHVKKFSFEGEILLDQESKEIDFGEGKKLKRANADISYWYDNFFIVHGTQKISKEGIFNNRKVFFMSKIKVD